MHLLKSTQFWVLALCPKVCQHLPSDLEMFLCVSGTSKNVFGAWGPNRSWDIDLLFFWCICSTIGQFWVLPLCPHVCQHLLSDLEMFLYVSRTSKKYLLHWALIEAEIFAQFSPLLGTGTLPAGVSTPVKWSRNVSMCLRNLQKVFGVWGPNRSWDIDIPAHHVFAQCGLFWVLVIYLWVYQHLPSSLQMFLYVSGTSKKYLVYGDLIETEILISPPQGICSTCPCYWALALYPKVCQHLPSSLIMFLCVLGTSKKYLVHGALIEAGILTSTLPHAFAQCNPVLSAGTLPKGVSTTVKWSRNVPMCLRNFQNVFGAWGLNRSWDIDLPAPHVFAQLGLVLGTYHSTHGVSTSSQVVYQCSYMSQEPPKMYLVQP